MSVNIYSPLSGDGLEAEEIKLYNLVNEYRAQNGLPPIPASRALTTVANRHVQDLAENGASNNGGFHAWSDAPYDSNNPNTWSSMWTAPQRLNTGYPGNGYENAFGGSQGFVASAENAMQSWKNSPAHNQVILNQDIWQNRQWNALGVGIYKGYAVLWFGEEVDPTGTPDGSGTSALPPSDPMFGTDNSEVLTGGAGSDTIVALGGNDTISGTAGDDYANGNIGNDYVSGDDGSDYILGGQNEDIVIGGIGDDAMVNGNKGNDFVYGGEGNDTVHGGQESDICYGENGDDRLAGDLGVDTLIGGAGSDLYVLRGDTYDIVYYDDAEDFLVLPDGVSTDNLGIIQGFDEYLPDGLVETQLLNASTGQVLAVLPGVDASSIDLGDFLAI